VANELGTGPWYVRQRVGRLGFDSRQNKEIIFFANITRLVPVLPIHYYGGGEPLLPGVPAIKRPQSATRCTSNLVRG